MSVRLPEFRLETYFAEHEFTARYHLTASDAETLTIAELLAMSTPEDREAFHDLPLSYVPTFGTEALRSAIAATYETIDADDVLVFAGAEEAMFWGLQELAGPDDHVLVTVPNYQSMETLPRAAGATVEGLSLDPSRGWRLDLEQITTAVRPSTRMIAVNFPNNPTGAVCDGETFTELAAFCDARGIRLFSDEVYRGLEQDPGVMLPQAADLSPTALSVNVMSKAYGLPGLRIGWIACRDRDLLARLERLKHYTSICNAGPSEHLATIALNAAPRILERNRAIIAANLQRFDAFFARWPEHFAWSHPQGGCVAYPRLLTGEPTSSFCRRLVQDAGVLLLPSDVYASKLAPPDPSRFRIGVGRRDPEPALEAFARFLERDLPRGDVPGSRRTS
jgi:aspartate/methionine/tyrosine aminotransferase